MNFLFTQINPKSQYVAFLEGDDMYDPDNLAHKLSIFEEDETIDCVYSHYRLIDDHGQRIS